MNRPRPRLALACVLLALMQGAVAQRPCSDGKPVEGTLARDGGQLVVVLHYAHAPSRDPLAEARRLLRETLPQAEWRERPPAAGERVPRAWALGYRERDRKAIRPPSRDLLDYKSRGLSDEQKAALLQTREIALVAFHLPAAPSFWSDFVAANQLVVELARRTGGLLLDDDTREFFSPEAWESHRLRERAAPLVLVRHTTIHAYRDGDYVRAVTLGLQKFGLPDLSVAKLAWSEGRMVEGLINALAQRMAEAPLPVRGGQVDLRVADLQRSSLRTALDDRRLPGATGTAALCLYDARPEPGDADNRQLLIGFDRAAGRDVHERRNLVLTSLFGSTPSAIQPARAGDAELIAASGRARERMPQLRSEFVQGLKPNERLLVKAPFSAADGSTEYMWVEVARWEGGRLRGLLMSEPRFVRQLKSGQEITIAEKDFYDYIRVFADGREEGNETGRILEQRNRR